MSDTEVGASEYPHEQLLRDVSEVLASVDDLQDYLARVVDAVRTRIDGCDEVGVTLLVEARRRLLSRPSR